MSALVFPPPHLRRPAVLTAWAAVSVCQLIGHLTGFHARIKWPNDVLINERKVCGILIEQRSTGAGLHATVVGIGLNVTQPEEWFAEAGLTEGTSLQLHMRESPVCGQIAERLIAQLDAEYRSLLRDGLGTLEASWQRHLGLDGRQVTIKCAGESLSGRFLSATFAGLELEIGREKVRLQPELVRHITP
jgi:BirA family biotin operon repressor/biotin-[acetyl-CoA-carboxylase] ligase